MSLALCVVGCGHFAKTFVKEVRAFPGLGSADQMQLFFASQDRKRARAYCKMFDGEDSFGSYEEAAADPRVQAMYFCTPHHLHMEHALMAARFSKHVLVEKPIARTMEEGQRMVTAARDEGVKLMVAENYRYIPPVQKSGELIRQGAIGTLRFIQIQEESNFVFTGWRVSREMMGGGVLIDGGIHSVDMLVELGGMPEEVFASRLPPKFKHLEGEDGIVLVARLGSGATGLINHSWGIDNRSWKLWVSISGTKGRIYFQPKKPTMTLETDQGKKTFRFPEDSRGIGNMVTDFRDSILQNRPPRASGEEGLRDLQVVLAAYESAANKSSLALN